MLCYELLTSELDASSPCFLRCCLMVVPRLKEKGTSSSAWRLRAWRWSSRSQAAASATLWADSRICRSGLTSSRFNLRVQSVLKASASIAMPSAGAWRAASPASAAATAGPAATRLWSAVPHWLRVQQAEDGLQLLEDTCSLVPPSSCYPQGRWL